MFEGCIAPESEKEVERERDEEAWIYVAGMKERFSSAIPQCHVRMLERKSQSFHVCICAHIRG